MHTKLKYIVLLAFTLLFSYPLHADNQELLFEAGNKAYLDGDWITALNHWRQIEQAGYKSGDLFYNIGNASYKSGKLGQAILYWEKAVKMIGEDDDLSSNLEIARSRLIDDIDETVRLPVWDWFDQLRARFPAGSLAFFGVILSFLTFALLGLRRWLIRSSETRKRVLILVWCIFVLLIFDLALFSLQARDHLTHAEGIILITEVQILSAPTKGTGKLLFTLHEGTKIRVLRKLEGWYEISAGKDMQGWIKKDALGII
ncbi:MAG: hypothetical protein HQ568_02325 [Calditrichaeota bacterium]|nr:hypothetical protein [Calditrichota bacterium]